MNTRPPRTQAERRQATRQALMEAALLRIQAGETFDALSLRSITKAAGVVPAAFYRHFESLDDLGLALMDESFRTLRAMLRAQRTGDPGAAIAGSVHGLVAYVNEHRDHFAFIARARGSASDRLRRAVLGEIRLIASELATDLARYPHLRGWSIEDLNMVATLIVNAMISTVEAILETPAEDARAQALIAATAEKQLRLVMLGIPQWRSGGSDGVADA
ncbi:MAG TPA: TetR family transcriptional regulator [Solirubrobacteraceae bacterium]|nr:TetR family transcriptional regulator [Solirubrobacteraceae bacterium]